MIGEFLLHISDVQFISGVLLYTLLLIFLAYKKPAWYKIAFIIFVGINLFGITYTMGWNDSMNYSHDTFPDKTLLENHFSVSPNLTLLVHFTWLDRIHKHRLEKKKEQRERL